MKSLNNFTRHLLSSEESQEIKGGTFCLSFGSFFTNTCKPSTNSCNFSAPSYNCSKISFSGCGSTPKRNECQTSCSSHSYNPCNPAPVTPPAVVLNV